MSKIKYRSNPETLTYQRIEKSLKSKIFKVLYSLISAVFFAILGIVVFNLFFDSPKEKILKRENKILLLQYQELNKRVDELEKILAELQFRDDNIYRTIFEVEPISEDIRKAGIGGANRYEELENLEHSKIIINTSKKVDQLTKQIYIQSKSFDEIVFLAKNKQKWLRSVPAILPILIKDKFKITSHFGIRYDPVYRNVKKIIAITGETNIPTFVPVRNDADKTINNKLFFPSYLNLYNA